MGATSRSAPQYPLRPHPHLYEINTWAWLEELSARLGRPIKLADVPDSEWDALAKLGFDVVWLMGVWTRSAESRQVALADPANRAQYDLALPGWTPDDIVGSPYAVAKYVPDLRVGTWDSLDRVREKLHARGMALFLDFVGNHTALDHPWVRDHPDYYVQCTPEDFQREPSNFFRVDTLRGTFFLALARDPYFPPWKDVAQLNHFSRQMRAAQLADLRAISDHCDGVRCDMAMLHLNDIFAKLWSKFLNTASPPDREFWAEAHEAVPGFILLAEAYWGTEQRLLDLGFSFVYDKGLYNSVRDVQVEDLHTRLRAPLSLQSCFVRFLENHDEARCPAVFGKDRLFSVGTLMGTLPGMRFYHQGELDGCRVHLPITLRIAANEAPDSSTAAFFSKTLRISSDDVFHRGVWNLLSVTHEGDATSGNLVVYEWRLEKSWKVIAINLVGYASQGRVHFGEGSLPATEYLFYDELNDARYVRASDELRSAGLFLRREGFGVHLFEVTPL
ncbi:MAG TPA: alpha-amylase family glycosyl hydrolase [Candidatus Acidoferrales bacterium]|nr:alpha-amylase family glycosyl hydrolase [Candidatus Acidoferrales bacterium]